MSSTLPIGTAVLAGLLFTLPLAVPVIDVAFAAEKPLAAEKNPPGDIPDSQVFIDYVSPKDGFSLKVPEGWARTDRANGVSFVDKLDGVVLTRSDAPQPPTVDSVKKDYVGLLEKEERAVKIDSVKVVNLPAGSAIRIVYSSNSSPNEVTSKQVRLENQRFLYFKDGKLVALELYAPQGADNVDQWKLMSESFRWR
ncbi:hypothetical protein [Pseudaminobacter soli (ex Li et al. 2025)]|uniref:Lipoprotein n=1 Tax=Pseudaminobacter soli (ex Li et al. 2025) TaxID=1295366 RepID=A0A2P7RW16_9HYPH|nr:hypothetical protein [Mesorhizobium soli]PSJ54362.1 hypothetical protein C7I85_27330 [Mesorhizobium soli]